MNTTYKEVQELIARCHQTQRGSGFPDCRDCELKQFCENLIKEKE